MADDYPLYPESFVLPADSEGVGRKCFLCSNPIWAGTLVTFLLLVTETDDPTKFKAHERIHAAHFFCAETTYNDIKATIKEGD